MRIRFIIIIILSSSLGLSPVYGQPFWTEKSTYSDGEYLFAVGIATDVRNKEDGRVKAFDNGVREICNLMGIDDLPGVVILTQMTYEEAHKDGTYTIYRLLKVNEDALEEVAEKIQEEDDIEQYVEVWPSGSLKTKGYSKKLGGKTVRNGKWIWWYEDGQKRGEDNYKDGLRNGKTISWYRNGQKKFETGWRDGKENGKGIAWHTNGQKWREDNSRDGKLYGVGTMWYKNGQKHHEIEWHDGKMNGKGMTWYYHGQKKIEAEYRDGKLHGEATVWYDNGQKQVQGEYCDGKVIQEKYWDINGYLTDPQNTTGYISGLPQPSIMTAKYSIKEFAEKIKEKYPEYIDMDNEDLVRRMIKKYPEYKSWVDIPD